MYTLLRFSAFHFVPFFVVSVVLHTFIGHFFDDFKYWVGVICNPPILFGLIHCGVFIIDAPHYILEIQESRAFYLQGVSSGLWASY